MYAWLGTAPLRVVRPAEVARLDPSVGGHSGVRAVIAYIQFCFYIENFSDAVGLSSPLRQL
jgi:hypothetical protein